MEIKIEEKDFNLCLKCHEKIFLGEEILIKNQVVICKECSQKTSAICHWCYLPILRYELIHEVSEGWDIDGENRSANLIQCHSCYEYWLMETKCKKSSLKIKVLSNESLMFTATYSLAFLVFTLGWEPKSVASAKLKNWLFFFSFLTVSLTSLLFFIKFVLEWIKDKKNEKRMRIRLKKLEEELKIWEKKSKNHYIKK